MNDFIPSLLVGIFLAVFGAVLCACRMNRRRRLQKSSPINKGVYHAIKKPRRRPLRQHPEESKKAIPKKVLTYFIRSNYSKEEMQRKMDAFISFGGGGRFPITDPKMLRNLNFQLGYRSYAWDASVKYFKEKVAGLESVDAMTCRMTKALMSPCVLTNKQPFHFWTDCFQQFNLEHVIALYEEVIGAKWIDEDLFSSIEMCVHLLRSETKRKNRCSHYMQQWISSNLEELEDHDFTGLLLEEPEDHECVWAYPSDAEYG